MKKLKEYVKDNWIKYVKITFVIVCMIIVFIFSSQAGEDSSDTSSGFIRNIITFFNRSLSQERIEYIIDIVEPFVRKLAHYTIYAIGGFLIYNALEKKNVKKALLIGILYAVSDEIHQVFVPERAGRIFDVCIDSLGVLTGIYVYKFINFCYLKFKS